MKKIIFTFTTLALIYLGINFYSNSMNSDDLLVPQANLQEIQTPRSDHNPKLASNSKVQSKESENVSDANLFLLPKKKTSSEESFVFDPNNPLTFYKSSIPAFVAEKIGERWVGQSDILIDSKTVAQSKGSSSVRMVIIDHIKYWDAGQIPYEILDQGHREKIELAMSAISSVSKIEFIPKSDEADFILFKSDPSDQHLCQSHLGRIGGAQELIVGSGCVHGQILHELMHVLGFVHEQSREDRDQYITLNWENMLSNSRHNFQRLPAAISNPANIEFDFNSIMMYGSTAFSNNGLPAIVNREGKVFEANRQALSDRDIERIRKVYAI